MGIIRKISLVVAFLLVVEILYLGIDPYSAGLPFRSVQYAPEDFGAVGLSGQGGWPAASFNVNPILFACDISVAVLLILLLVRCIPSVVVIPVVQGCVLGSAAGGATLGLERILVEPWFSIVGAPILFVGVPVAIYWLSLGHKRQKTAIIILASATLPACIRASLVLDGLRGGIIEGTPLSLGLVLRLAAATCVLICLCFVVMSLHKRVLPAIRQKKPDIVPSPIVHSDAPQIARSSERASRRIMIRRAALYTSLLAVVVYIGCHFMTIKKMREADSGVSEAITAEFERLKVPFEKCLFMSPKGDSELLKDRWNVLYQVEVLVDDKTTYEAQINKSIIVPWVQVKIHKKE